MIWFKSGVKMQKFDYRSPRFTVDLPVQFTVQHSTLSGRCSDISTEGMRLELRQPLPPNASGTVSMSYRDRTVELEVRVAHAGATHGGMKFVYKSECERSAVAHFIASVASTQSRLCPIPVN